MFYVLVGGGVLGMGWGWLRFKNITKIISMILLSFIFICYISFFKN